MRNRQCWRILGCMTSADLTSVFEAPKRARAMGLAGAISSRLAANKPDVTFFERPLQRPTVSR